MAVFECLPDQIRKAVLESTSKDEQIKMCFVAGSSLSSGKDYVVITSRRVLVVDERPIGYLGRSYVNVKEDMPVDQITSIEITRTLMNRLLGQSSLELQTERYKYMINNGSSKEIRAAADLIGKLARMAGKSEIGY